MSISAVEWVLEAAPAHTASTRAVALIIAWHHTPAAGSFPSRATIAAETRLGAGTVGRALLALEAEGTIERVGYRDGGGTVIWRFPGVDGLPTTGGPTNGDTPSVGEPIGSGMPTMGQPQDGRSNQSGHAVYPETHNGLPTVGDDRKDRKEIGTPPNPPMGGRTRDYDRWKNEQVRPYATRLFPDCNPDTATEVVATTILLGANTPELIFKHVERWTSVHGVGRIQEAAT